LKQKNGPPIARLAQLGLERDFSLARFQKSLAAASSKAKTGEVLRRLLTDWTGLHFSPEEAERHWEQIERQISSLRKKLGPPLGLPTVLLYYFHSAEGLLREPRLLPERELSVLRINAITDPLTGLYNRRFLLEHLEREMSRAERGGGIVSIILMDLKGFKEVNEQFGHPVGDSLLVRTAKIIRNCLRAIDAGGRWGGDEFVVVAPNTDLMAAFAIADRIRRRVGSIAFPRTVYRIGIHYGTAAYPTDGKTADFILKVADLRLHQCREQSQFGGPERRSYPRFSPAQADLRLQWRTPDRTWTASILDLSHRGLSFKTAWATQWPFRWKAEIVQRHAPERHTVRLRALHSAPLPDGALRIGCAYA